MSEGQTAEAAEKAAQLLKIASEIEKEHAEAEKLEAEQKKLSQDADNSAEQARAERRRFYVTLLTPLVTTLVLAGTLILQTAQFIKAERDKQTDLQRQDQAREQEDKRREQAADDVRWDEAVKSLAVSDKLTASTLLKRFLGSERYAPLARDLEYQLLLKSDRPEIFSDLFVSIFAPVSWANLPKICDLNRTLNADFEPLLRKKSRTVSESARYNLQYTNIAFTSLQIASLLKSPRPKNVVPDLQGISIWDCDMSNSDLSGANLVGNAFTRVVLKGADLSGVTAERFQGISWKYTAWWQVSKIGPELLDYLCRQFPFREIDDFGAAVIPPGDYAANLKRLGAGSCVSTITQAR
jgi:hypothetical protein